MSIHRYVGRMTATKMTKAEASKKALAAHIAATVASWPPPTPEQARMVVLMCKAVHAKKHGIDLPAHWAKPAPVITERRKAEDALAKLGSDFTEALDGCRACGLTRVAHKYQEGYAVGYHSHEALTPDDTLKLAAIYKKKIAAAKKAVEAA